MPRGGRRCDLGGRGQRPRPRTSSGGDCVSTFDDALEQAKQAQDIRDQEERDYRARQRAEREAGEEAVSRVHQLVSEGRDKIEPRWFRTVSWPREGSRPDVVSRPEGTSGKHGWVTRRSRAPEPSGNQMAQMSSVRGWVVHSSDDVSEGGSLSWHLTVVCWIRERCRSWLSFVRGGRERLRRWKRGGAASALRTQQTTATGPWVLG